MTDSSRERARLKRYEAVAADIVRSIDTGTLRPGDRLPSVRQASAARRVSVSTIFQAYYLLEARGYIQARDRSGYYVSTRKPAPPEPETSHPDGNPAPVDVQALAFDVLGSVRDPATVPLGSAFPSPMLFPLVRLASSLKAGLRRMDPWSSVSDMFTGNAALRRQIAVRYLIDGMDVHGDDLVITNGAMEALQLALMAVTRPGDTVLIESPAFYATLQALERMKLHAVEVPTSPRTGIQLDALARAIERHRPQACWIMSNFQNPTGSLMPDETKRDLVALLAGHGIPLIEDDVYGELYFGRARPLPAKAHDRDGLVLHCASFSKCLAPGYRVGWVAAGRYARDVERQKLMTTLASPSPNQLALAEYLDHGGYDRHLRQLRATLARQQQHMMAALARYFPEGTRASRPQGGYFLWVQLPPGADALDVYREALARRISVAPGPIFSPRGEYRDCLRLNYGHPWDETLEDAMRVLGEIVARQVVARPPDSDSDRDSAAARAAGSGAFQASPPREGGWSGASPLMRRSSRRN
ncbi:PLP-dependent aminotransferase family protein [Bordetella bronchialis]|uniref:GntR family transcriptional regulator n=1 Tax=Bordetella bronchialis TaxID=463025 RepID=A0A193FMS7_9BORD|nr:PLP-dependent aminotransferase family protein [Bordetella bronchialis]ANN68404.1 GntR family transcriptional regulator [Bordetella bronchialis]ANN73545.1 GntR family transcriptional regulator [Bordetella bronchialis]